MRYRTVSWVVGFVVACDATPSAIVWTPIADLNATLPTGVQVFEGIDYTSPLRAWYVRVDPDALATVDIVQSSDATDNRETAIEFATNLDACVAVNGGYFSMTQVPAVHAGLLLQDGVMRAGATRTVTRDSIGYPAVRATLGILADGDIEIAWTTSRGDTVFAWNQTPDHRPGEPAAMPSVEHRRVWPAVDALGAGPLLVRNGRVEVGIDGEVFFGSAIPAIHPRTAAGRTTDGALILLVVDGRQPQSRGVDLSELADIMLDLGAEDALNLDGGGSSTMVVSGRLLNRPAGGTVVREVMSAIVVRCN